MGRRGPKPWQPVPAAEVLRRYYRLPPFRRRRQRHTRRACLLTSEVTGLGGDWFGAGEVEHRYIPMPRGGYRMLVRCPRCGRWVLRLYIPDRSGPGSRGPWWCRHCWDIRYPSQFEGRRPVAAPERMAALIESIRSARSDATQELRFERFDATLDLLNERELRWLQREIANTPKWMQYDAHA
jgi:hypothetical protein